jgi:tetratricopeptide (TPR) repeat protein
MCQYTYPIVAKNMKNLLLPFLTLLLLIGCNSNITEVNNYINQSSNYLRNEEYQKSLDVIVKAIKLDETNAAAYNNLGVTLFGLKYDYDTVLSCYQKSIALDPEYSIAKISMLNFYWEYEDFENVIKVFQILKDNHQPNSQLNNIIGESYRNLDNLKNASSHLLQAIKQDSTNWSAFLNLGEVHMDKLDWSRAKKYLKKSLQLNPNYAATYNEIGICEFEMDNINSALEYATDAIEIKNDSIYWLNKAIYLTKTDSVNQGCQIMNKFLDSDEYYNLIIKDTASWYHVRYINSCN